MTKTKTKDKDKTKDKKLGKKRLTTLKSLLQSLQDIDEGATQDSGDCYRICGNIPMVDVDALARMVGETFRPVDLYERMDAKRAVESAKWEDLPAEQQDVYLARVRAEVGNEPGPKEALRMARELYEQEEQ